MNGDRIPMYSPGNPIAYDNVAPDDEEQSMKLEPQGPVCSECRALGYDAVSNATQALLPGGQSCAICNAREWSAMRFMPGEVKATAYENVAQGMKQRGYSPTAIYLALEELNKDEVWINEKYQVAVRVLEPAHEEVPPMTHLSIKHRDRSPIHDWRELQAIKNALVGPECEAVELYPAERRKVDTANQYHLWVLSDSDIRFPFGFQEREVRDNPIIDGAVQRPGSDE